MNATHSMRVAAVLLSLILYSNGEVVIKDKPEIYTRWAHNVCAATADEGYIIMWQGTKNGTKEIAAQKYDTDGNGGEKIQITSDTEVLVDRKCSIASLEQGSDFVSAYISDSGIGVSFIATNPNRAFFSVIPTNFEILSLVVSPLFDTSAASIFVSNTSGTYHYKIDLLNDTLSWQIPTHTLSTDRIISGAYLKESNEQLLCLLSNDVMKMVIVSGDGTSKELNIDPTIKLVTLSTMVAVHSHPSIVALYWSGGEGTFVQLYSAVGIGGLIGNRHQISSSQLPDIHISSIPGDWLVATETELSSELTGRLLRIDNQDIKPEYSFTIKDHYEGEVFSGLTLGFQFSNIGGFAVLWHGLGASFTQHYNILRHSLAPTTPAPPTYAPETSKPTPGPPSSGNVTEAPIVAGGESSSSFPKWVFALIAFVVIDIIVIAAYLYRSRSGDRYVPADGDDGHEMEQPVRDYSPPYIQ
eukprot:TRINITY_DN1705_c0_g1_i1.p1 TRINITY_DN1705_c0_g1~~TRINITY_DN1705_c0_g1_i1.p1  ORF type:complete len:482 (+),score=97.77 TRINITY_DN1705_c0_g1_i1:40-1446(+)